MSRLLPGLLALFITGLHGNTVIRSRRVDRAVPVAAEKIARPIFSTGDDERTPDVALQLDDNLLDGLAGAVRISLNESWLTEDIQVVGLHDEKSLAVG